VHPHVVHAIPDDERERTPENQQAFLDLRHTFRLKAEATSTVPSFPPSGGRSVPHAEATTTVLSFPPSGGRSVAHAEATTTVLSFPPSGGRPVAHVEATTTVLSFPPSGGRPVAHAEATTTVLSFPPSGGRTVAQHERRDVVALCGAFRERAHVGEDRLGALVRRRVPLFLAPREVPRLAVLLAARRQRFRHAVAEHDEPVAGIEEDGLLLEARRVEQPDDRAADVEPAHAAPAEHERRGVACVAVRQGAGGRGGGGHQRDGNGYD